MAFRSADNYAHLAATALGWTLVDVAPGSRRSSMTSTAATPLPWQDHELQLVLDALDRLAAALTPAPLWAPTIGEYLGTAFTGWRTLSNTPDDDRIDPLVPGVVHRPGGTGSSLGDAHGGRNAAARRHPSGQPVAHRERGDPSGLAACRPGVVCPSVTSRRRQQLPLNQDAHRGRAGSCGAVPRGRAVCRCPLAEIPSDDANMMRISSSMRP